MEGVEGGGGGGGGVGILKSVFHFVAVHDSDCCVTKRFCLS